MVKWGSWKKIQKKLQAYSDSGNNHFIWLEID